MTPDGPVLTTGDLLEYVLEPLQKDEEFILYRGKQPGQVNAPSVLLRAPASSRPAPESLEKLEHEYAVRSELLSEWAIRPVALSLHNVQTMLVLDDPGGEPLARLIHGPMEMTQFLQIAADLAAALDGLHKQRLIHKDLKPSNVLINAETRRLWLMGFGIASRLPRHRQSPEPPEIIAGTLAYMAPEQTGRMNRSIDSRSDLYALGVTLYEMLTGSLPFTASDPMEWVHCHIARQPPPGDRRTNIPLVVSAIVLKLLAKTAEERYQTAAGVEADLRRCLDEWSSRGRIETFALGAQDVPDRLLIPEKLYGRAREIDTLLASFHRIVASGKPELLLVSGYSGIGKSSVVNELHKVLVPPRGLFASGKFDQYKRDIPYATLAQAFQSLIRPLLGKSEAELQKWRDALRDALGQNGRLIIDLVPELKLFIGEQPPVPDLPPQDAQGRFQLVFRRFIGVFARPEHPLALFLDDLQWIDAATLDLLEDVLTHPDVQHVMFVGAYRDNEVSAAHPLIRKLEAIRSAGAPVEQIVLAPLTGEDLGRLIADALHCELERVTPLAQLLHEKSAGNPFFAIQFLHALSEEGLLTFDHGHARWSWDLDRIREKRYTDNVVDLMVGKLTRLPVETRTALEQLACMGNSADFTVLTLVAADSTQDIHRDLEEAVRSGLVLQSHRAYRFLHDRVQEAAYSLIAEDARGAAHLRIGRLLAARTPPDELGEKVFEIVSQLNRGSHLITSREERDRVAELNFLAGRRAKTSTAYASALGYLAAARFLLTESTWQAKQELMFAVEFDTAECELLTGNISAAEDRLSMLARRARRAHQIAAVARLRLTLYTTLGRSDRGVEVCLEYLAQTGTQWSPHPTIDEVRREYDRVWSQLGDRSIEGLIDLPLMTDPNSIATLDVLAEMIPSSLYTDENLNSLVICRMVNLSLEDGNTDASSFAYVWFGMMAGERFGSHKPGLQFGRLGCDLPERRGLTRFQARTYATFAAVAPWTRDIRTNRDLVRRAFDAAYKNGDLTFAAFSCKNLNTNLLVAGDPLADVHREAETGLQFAQKARFGVAVDMITTQLALIRTLRGLTTAFGSFDGDSFDESRFERHLSDGRAMPQVECWYWIAKLQARFFAGDYASALDASSRAEPLLWASPCVFENVDHHFYGALAHAASCDSESPDRRRHHVEAVAASHQQLERWAENCPEQLESLAALVGAEIARLEGRELDAERLYEKAIRSAHANRLVQNEALANELAARFYGARGFDKIAHVYLRDARYGYVRWGATGKVGQLDRLYPQLREDHTAPGRTSTIAAPVDHLDLATVIKVSQAVSGEIVLERLIDTLMRTALECAGAERGLLMFPPGWIQAEATTGGDGVVVQLREAVVDDTALPESIVNYVVRTNVSVTLDDASAPNPFAADPYIQAHRARSTLCLPLVNQAKLIGVLYLENNLAPHAFTLARVAVLTLLASQAAISLENTRLYRDLEAREAKIRRLVDANIIGILTWNAEGVIEANDAFLQMLQYSRDDLASGRVRWADLTPAEWRDTDSRAGAEVRATGTIQPYEKEYFRKDGSRVPVLLGAAMFEGSGTEGVAFVLDLTNRKQTEETLRRTQAYLAEAQTLTHTGSWACNIVSRTIIYSSDEHSRLYGFDPTRGTPAFDDFHERIHPDDIDRVEANLLAASRAGEDVEMEFRAVLPDGTIRFLLGVGHPVVAPGHEPGEFVGFLMDVTDRRRADEERERLRQVQADLAHMTRVTTMGELTASLAHEIKQPITAALTDARTCLRWLGRDDPDLAEAREAASRLVKDVTRAADIIGRIGVLFKKGALPREPVDVNELVREMIAMLAGEVTRHAIVIRTDLDADLPKVIADRVQLQQVFMNLMLNGIEAMKATAGRRQLTIGSRGDHDELVISVSDTGVGLEPEQMDQIFRPFYTTKHHGIGMGLSISRSIIESHGGRMWAATNSPGGATFHFSMPAFAAAPA